MNDGRTTDAVRTTLPPRRCTPLPMITLQRPRLPDSHTRLPSARSLSRLLKEQALQLPLLDAYLLPAMKVVLAIERTQDVDVFLDTRSCKRSTRCRLFNYIHAAMPSDDASFTTYTPPRCQITSSTTCTLSRCEIISPTTYTLSGHLFHRMHAVTLSDNASSTTYTHPRCRMTPLLPRTRRPTAR